MLEHLWSGWPLMFLDHFNKYILIAADYFTKWVDAYPPANQEAVTVAEVLVREFVSRSGVPLILHSDQGHNFESAVFPEMCSPLFYITTVITTSIVA